MLKLFTLSNIVDIMHFLISYKSKSLIFEDGIFKIKLMASQATPPALIYGKHDCCNLTLGVTFLRLILG